MSQNGTLYQIPGLLGPGDPKTVLGLEALEAISKIRYFIVESQKSAVRFLVGCGMKEVLDECEFSILNKHTSATDFGFLMEPVLEGRDAGIITDAGCPGVADPGAELVALAHLKQILVVPLIGPTSVILALMGSGLNGQTFAFHGYLPVQQAERCKKIRELEKQSARNNETQMFIEAPYRNRALLTDLLNCLHPETRLCVAANLTQPDQLLKTGAASWWKKHIPDIHKKPAIFLFLA